MSPELRAAFEEMKRTDMVLDDEDYATHSPKLLEAMRAADRFRELLESEESR